MRNFIQWTIATTVAFTIFWFTAPNVKAQPVELFTIKEMPASEVPQYEVRNATTIQNSKTRVTYTLKRFEPRDKKTNEGKEWLKGLASNGNNQRLPKFLPMQCEEVRTNLMQCEDILLPQAGYDSITRTGVFGYMAEKEEEYAGKY